MAAAAAAAVRGRFDLLLDLLLRPGTSCPFPPFLLRQAPWDRKARARTMEKGRTTKKGRRRRRRRPCLRQQQQQQKSATTNATATVNARATTFANASWLRRQHSFRSPSPRGTPASSSKRRLRRSLIEGPGRGEGRTCPFGWRARSPTLEFISARLAVVGRRREGKK